MEYELYPVNVPKNILLIEDTCFKLLKYKNGISWTTPEVIVPFNKIKTIGQITYHYNACPLQTHASFEIEYLCKKLIKTCTVSISTVTDPKVCDEVHEILKSQTKNLNAL